MGGSLYIPVGRSKISWSTPWAGSNRYMVMPMYLERTTTSEDCTRERREERYLRFLSVRLVFKW